MAFGILPRLGTSQNGFVAELVEDFEQNVTQNTDNFSGYSSKISAHQETDE